MSEVIQQIEDLEIIVNPARVKMVMMLKGQNITNLKRLTGIEGRKLARGSQPSGYTASFSRDELERLSKALGGFLPEFFLQGDEEEDFQSMNDIAESLTLNLRRRVEYR